MQIVSEPESVGNRVIGYQLPNQGRSGINPSWVILERHNGKIFPSHPGFGHGKRIGCLILFAVIKIAGFQGGPSRQWNGNRSSTGLRS